MSNNTLMKINEQNTYMFPSELWNAKHMHEANREISASLFLPEEALLSGNFLASLLAVVLTDFVTVVRFNFIKSVGLCEEK